MFDDGNLLGTSSNVAVEAQRTSGTESVKHVGVGGCGLNEPFICSHSKHAAISEAGFH